MPVDETLHVVEIIIPTEQHTVTEIGGLDVLFESDYTKLENQPKINGHTLSGDQTGGVLGLVSATDEYLTDAQVDENILTITKSDGTEVQFSGGSGGASTWNAITGKPFSSVGDGLKVENGALKVDTTNDALQDNTKPITSGGVYTVVGNINALLGTI